MTWANAEAMLRADESGESVVFNGQIIPASAVYDYLTNNGEHPEEVDWFNSLDREDKIEEIMSW